MFKINSKNMIFSENIQSLLEDAKTIFVYSAGNLKKYRVSLTKASLLKALSFPIGISIVYITKVTLDKGIIGKNLDLFIKFTLLGMAAFVLSRFLQYLSNAIIRKVKTHFAKDVNYGMTDRLFGLSYLKIKELSSAENTFILDYDYHVIENLIFDEAPALISLVKIPILFILAAMFSVPLALIAFLSFPFVVMQTLWAARIRKKFREKEMYYIQKHYSHFHDILLNMKLIKSLFKEDWALNKVSDLFSKKKDRSLESLNFFHKSRFISDLFIKLNTVAFGLFGGYLIITGRLTLGSFSAVSMYALLIVSEMYSISGILQGLNEERISISRNAFFIKEISEKKNAEVMPFAKEVPQFTEDIEFRDITFGYTEEKTLFKNLSCVITGGKSTLIKGASGVGKTTLLSLLLRLFSPTSGSILVGGENINRIDRKLFSENISVVHQEPYLFNDTFLNNILMEEERDSEVIEKALVCSKAAELAGEMPLGYNSQVGEAGLALSGGQKQRLAIARALVREPKILIMDEATSFLDTETEEEIFKNIKRSFPGLTIIFVTHRPSVEKFADEILILEDDKIFKESSIPVN